MLKIAISGSTGLVGSRIIELLDREFVFIPILQKEVDITDQKAITNKLDKLGYDIFLHLAAYTNVDGAETNKELAYKINVEGTKNLFNETLRKSKKFIYVSTDFVFDGTNPPYYEDSKPNPLGQYAKTKYEAEQLVKDKAMIIRITYPYRANFPEKLDYVARVKKNLEDGKEIEMSYDSLFTPTFIDDIAYALKHLFLNFSEEIFHIVGSSHISHFEAGRLIAKTFDLDSDLIQKIESNKYILAPGRAPRPQYLDTRTKKNNFYRMKTFEEGLAEIKKQI